MDEDEIDIAQNREKSSSEGPANSDRAKDLWDRIDKNGKTMQSGQKRYHCIDCGKSFTRKSSLIVHQRIHTGEKLFMCTECGKRFGLKSSMVRHMRTHTPKVLNICPDCGKCFTRYSSLFQHQKVHRKERPYKCSHCEKNFSRATQLVVHQRIHKRNLLPGKSECGESCSTVDKPSMQKRAQQANVCLQCGKIFRALSSLIRHQKLHRVKTAFPTDQDNGFTHVSSVDEKADCNVSGSLHKKKNNLHQRINESAHAETKAYSEDKRFLCIDCGKSFTRKSSLIVHYRIHTGEKLFMCAECGKSFGLKSSLVRHMRTHSPKVLNICSDCGKCFSRYSSLFQHQKVHKRQKRYKCPHCLKNFSRASQLLIHQKIHKVEKLRPKSGLAEDLDYRGDLNSYFRDNCAGESHVCLQCGKCFRRQSAFIRHQRIHIGNGHSFNSLNRLLHTGTYSSISEPIYTGKGYMEPQKKELSDVLEKSNTDEEENRYIAVSLGDNADRKVSSGAKRFLCIDCGKSFTRKSSLIVHQRIHTGEKLFMCAECGKRFGLKSSLVRHMRTHSPKVLNICPDCGKCFSRYSSLFQHQKVHKREKRYKCPHCQKSFSRVSQFVTHQKTHKAGKFQAKSEHTGACDYQGKRGASYMNNPGCHADSDIQNLETENNCKSLAVKDNFKLLRSHNPENFIFNTMSEDFESEVGNGKCTSNKKSIPKRRSFSSKKPYHCIQCGKNFTRKSSLIVHQRVHTGEKLFMCTECGKRFAFKSSLVRHLRTHSGETLNICSECGIYFSQYGDLILHLENHKSHLQLNQNVVSKIEPGEELSMDTDEVVTKVPLVTEQESSLLDKDHGNEYPLPIASLPINDYLDSQYADREGKKQNESMSIKQESPENICTPGEHIESHKNEDVIAYPYSLDWGAAFDFSKSLIEETSGKMERTDESENHLEQTVLNEINKGSLGISFWDESDQINKSTQSGEKRFLCTECGKRFTRKSSLIVHQRIHTGEKLFMCTECGKRFGLKSSMVRHMRTHSVQCFTCIECGKSFRDHSKLLQHETSHTADWPYSDPHLTVH